MDRVSIRLLDASVAQSSPFASALAGSGAAPPSSPPCSMAPHAAVGTRNLTAHLHYCPPFQPWGLLHGIAVTVSGVLFWVGVWDILDYAVLPRGWPWRLLAVFMGTAGMYVTGTLWTAPRTGPLRGSYVHIQQHQGQGVGRRGGQDEALARRSTTAGWLREQAPGGASSGGRSKEHSVVEMTALSGGQRSPPHPSTAPTQVVADSSPGGGAGGARDDDMDNVLEEHSPGASSSRCVAYAYDRVPFFSRRGGGSSSAGGDASHPGEAGRHGGRQMAHRRLPAAWMPYSHFFARPAFHRPTFFKHLLSHLAAVAAWTGLWDVLDQSLLPWISQSCVLAPGFVAEYPCVLVKVGFVTLGALGLHWTGTLYYTLEEEGSMPLGGGHRDDMQPGTERRRARQRGGGRQEEGGDGDVEEDEGVWVDDTQGWQQGTASDGLLLNGGAHHGVGGSSRLTRRGSATVLLAKLKRRRMALGKATGRMTKRGKALMALALNSASLDAHR